MATIEGRLTALVSQTRWSGNDASAFMSDWHRSHRVSIRTVTQTLQSTAVDLRRNAAQQEAASQAGGGGVPGSASGTVSGGAAGTVPGGGQNLDTLKNFANDLNANPVDGARWWDSLSTPEQKDLLLAHPELLGNMEGIDYKNRSQANNENIENLIDEARDRGDDNAVDYLKAVRDAADGGPPTTQLISLEGGPPPLAAISIGNLDKAEYTTFLIPGMASNGTTSPGDLICICHRPAC
ncbi:MAG: hypothetical protein ACOH1J_07865 [Microbacteriaceae bacterium]